MKLTPEQIALIDKHLRSLWLSNPDFIAEMTDHYVCAMEGHLSNQISWQDGLRIIDIEFGGRSKLMKMEAEYVKSIEHLLWLRLWSAFKRYFISVPQVFITVGLFVFFYMITSYFNINLATSLQITANISTAITLIPMVYVLRLSNWGSTKTKLTMNISIIWLTLFSLMQIIGSVGSLTRHFTQPTYFLCGLATLLLVSILISIEMFLGTDWKALKKT